MIRNIALSAATAAALVVAGGGALAAETTVHIEDVAFPHEGPFGTFDRNQLQRGLQVYTEVCSACHGLKFVPIRTLSDEGGPQLPEDQVRAYAANLSVNDEASNPKLIDPETGSARTLVPADNFPANAAAGAPDLSLMTKARAGFHGPYGLGLSQLFRGTGGPEYMHALLTGYTGEEKEEAGSVFYENHAFPGGWIKMPPPLSDDQVSYADGTAATVDQMSMDVSAFLMWTAEPQMMNRKETGFKAVVFLIIFASLLYLTNKRIWAGVKGKKTA